METLCFWKLKPKQNNIPQTIQNMYHAGRKASFGLLLMHKTNGLAYWIDKTINNW